MLPEKLPFISILVAARNEEKDIESCLAAIEQLDYPPNRYEVWVGDDGSEDKTNEIIESFIKGKHNYHLKHISDSLNGAKGKPNVLAQLAREAKGTYFLFTDADVEVSSTWAKAMVDLTQKGYGIVTGFTMVRNKSFLGGLQAIDWLYAQQMITAVTTLGIPVTSMGNNMLIDREAYFSTGGFENLPFNLTEDYAIFKAVVANGFGFKNIMCDEVMAYTHPIEGLIPLLHQRKRWMKGAMAIPFYMRLPLFLQALYLPILLVLFFLSPQLALYIFIGKLLIQFFLIGASILKFNQLKLLFPLLFYEVYIVVLSFLTVIFYYLPVKIKWKGREYE